MMSLTIGWKVIPQLLVSSEHEVVDSLEGKGFCGVDGDWDRGALSVEDRIAQSVDFCCVGMSCHVFYDTFGLIALIMFNVFSQLGACGVLSFSSNQAASNHGFHSCCALIYTTP